MNAAARLSLVVLLSCVDCSTESPVDPQSAATAHLPDAWHEAAVDPDTGGRYLPQARDALRRFQATIATAGGAVLYPDYHGSRTVVLGVKSAFVQPRIRRRVEALLESEGAESDLRVLALTDAPVETIAAALGPIADDPRLSLVRVERGSSPATFAFVRDYAPLVRVHPVRDGFETTGLVVFGGSTLNKVIDRELAVSQFRSLEGLRGRLARSRAILDVYTARLPPGVLTDELTTALDGGNLLSDGRGSCFLTEIVLDQTEGDAARIPRDLRDRAGCARSFFLKAPQRLDFVQHVDTLLFFADAENAVLSMPILYEGDLARDAANTRTLLELGYTVHRLPRRTASVTYANILVTRSNVYVPQYTGYHVESERQLERNRRIAELDRSLDRDELRDRLREPSDPRLVVDDPALEDDNQRALDVIARLMPTRRVVPWNSDETLGSLGSWHCLSHGLPEALGP